MRTKIDYGIDLGTTNSAIARMENGVPVIKKSDTLKDTLPSCVSFNRRQDILVGDAAINVMKTDSARSLKTFAQGTTNTFIEFKRTMGTTHTYESTNMKRSFTPAELSAEVLKRLKAFIQDENPLSLVIQNENLSSIVITVPAKFSNQQCEATMQAAKLAGFKQVQLLQEPVAAATAYGLGTDSKDGFWLVFDFGGGTFDAALVKTEGGILSVRDTEGDNWLGGKNLDEAIIDKIIIPHLQENYAINFILNDSDKKQMLRSALKYFAEDAKNQLSFKEKYNILSNLGDLPFEDENGNEPEIDLEVKSADLERVFSPIFQKAIDITKDLLRRNNLQGSSIDKMILVGGPTHSPILRRMLKEQITDNVDTYVDPMTVVAKGAALYASTIAVTDEIQDETRDTSKLQLEIDYEATSVETTELVTIKVLREKSVGTFPSELFVEIARADGAWSSSRTKVGEKAALVEVVLVEGRPNAYTINVFDGHGNRIKCEPEQFNILQGIGGLDCMQVLPYNICIVKYFEDVEKELIAKVQGLDKNKPFPVTGTRNGLKTRMPVRPGMAGDIIRIPVYQGDYNADGTNPALNNIINEVIITGESLPALLPEGSDIDITIKVDKSGLMKFSAYFPLLDYTEELEIKIKPIEAPDVDKLTKDIASAKHSANLVQADDILQRIESLEQQLENEKGNADGRLKILEGLRKELLQLDPLEKELEWPKIEQDLKSTFFILEDYIKKIKLNGDTEDLNMKTIDATLHDYRQNIDAIIRAKNAGAAKQLTSEIIGMVVEIENILTGGKTDVSRLQYHDENFNTLKWKDPAKARALINEGKRLIAGGRIDQLRPILEQIWALRIDGDVTLK
ncbi:MAG: Hsp70 family protein [Prevotellaceae bacterium]|jgi:molecular chaperone DnaK|nr:Hsp70 family protein [Prevotellaceae bacterium]